MVGYSFLAVKAGSRLPLGAVLIRPEPAWIIARFAGMTMCGSSQACGPGPSPIEPWICRADLP
jgi:hypothetical protein